MIAARVARVKFADADFAATPWMHATGRRECHRTQNVHSYLFVSVPRFEFHFSRKYWCALIEQRTRGEERNRIRRRPRDKIKERES